MENTIALSQVQASGSENCSSPVLNYFHGRISELQRNLYDAILAPREDTQQIENLRLEQEVVGELIHWRTTRDQHQSRCLQDEYNAHALTKHELITERQFHLQTAETNAELQQLLDTQQKMHHDTLTELNNLRSWCSWVDSMIDIKGLEEERQNRGEEELWNVEEMIKSIENKAAKDYQKLLQERENHMDELNVELERLRNELERLSYKPRKVKQRQSPRTKPVPIAKKQPA